VTLRIQVTPEAEADINEAYVWYEQTSAGLGDRFAGALRETLSGVAKRSTAFRTVYGPMRRDLGDRFPYSVFYVHDDWRVVVIRCLHARRDPTSWRIRGRRYGDA
jgi:plasmid stabilization system protein ParE